MKRLGILMTSILFASVLVTPAHGEQNARINEESETKRVMKHWTAERIKSATPRDLFIDAAGNTFMGDKVGKLSPYGGGTKFKSNNNIKSSPSTATANVVSRVQRAVAIAPLQPAAPTAVAGDKQATISWVAPADNGVVITSYSITSSTRQSGNFSSVSSCRAVNALTCVATGLRNGSTYFFKVTAVSNAGKSSVPSGASTAVTPSPPPPQPPSQPDAPTAVAGNKQATISWVAPASNGVTIASYSVTSSTSPTGTFNSVSSCRSVRGLTCVATGLTNGNTYYFKVTATSSSGGNSAPSAASSAVTLVVPAPPSQPAAPTAGAGDRVAVISWEVPANNVVAISSYTVTSSTSPTGSFNSVSSCRSVTSLSCTATGLRNGTTYYFKVTANNAGGSSAPSAASNSVTPSAPSNTVVVNSRWSSSSSSVLSASGRLLFEMPDVDVPTDWVSYVCSGTVVSDGSTVDGQTLILTAAHCIYDDANKVFARNVIFIPNQQATTGIETDIDCTNDIYGCWAINFGVVDTDWTTREFPSNVAWDYGYYVVKNTGKHTPGFTTVVDALELAVTPMTINFNSPISTNASAFGYSASYDPQLRYCAELKDYDYGISLSMSDDWWLDSCGLTGGASGGPWLDENSVLGKGQIISVNSWGYRYFLGMAGPKLDSSTYNARTRSPKCIYNKAKTAITTDVVVTVCP